jgi:hypothetical protein
MPYYLLSVIQVPRETLSSEAGERIGKNNDALIQELKQAGVWVFGGRLHAPSTATTLRAQNGDVLMTDGPFAEAKEHLAGILIIDVPDLDAALAWGRKQTLATTLPIEVRPFHSAGLA